MPGIQTYLYRLQVTVCITVSGQAFVYWHTPHICSAASVHAPMTSAIELQVYNCAIDQI